LKTHLKINAEIKKIKMIKKDNEGEKNFLYHLSTHEGGKIFE